jgi:hypothetical protein
MRLSASRGTLLQCIVKLQKTGSGSLDNRTGAMLLPLRACHYGRSLEGRPQAVEELFQPVGSEHNGISVVQTFCYLQRHSQSLPCHYCCRLPGPHQMKHRSAAMKFSSNT